MWSDTSVKATFLTRERLWFGDYLVHLIIGFLIFLAQMLKNHRQCRRPRFDPWVRKIPCRRKWLLTLVFLPGKSCGQKEPGRLQSVGLQSQTRLSDCFLSFYFWLCWVFIPVWAFSLVPAGRGCSLVVHRLTVMASLVEHRLQVAGASAVVAPEL